MSPTSEQEIHLGTTLSEEGCLLQYETSYRVYLYLTADVVDISLAVQPPPSNNGFVISVPLTVIDGFSNSFLLIPQLKG